MTKNLRNLSDKLFRHIVTFIFVFKIYDEEFCHSLHKDYGVYCNERSGEYYLYGQVEDKIDLEHNWDVFYGLHCILEGYNGF